MPAKVAGLEGVKVVLVSAGDSHSAYLTDKGSVYVSGTFRVIYITTNASYTLPDQKYLCHKWLMTGTHMPLQIYRHNMT